MTQNDSHDAEGVGLMAWSGRVGQAEAPQKMFDISTWPGKTAVMPESSLLKRRRRTIGSGRLCTWMSWGKMK